jgi:hypothetical protein
MKSLWTGTEFKILGYTLSVYRPRGSERCRLAVFFDGDDDPCTTEYFATEKGAKEFGIRLVVADIKDQLNEIGYDVVESNT